MGGPNGNVKRWHPFPTWWFALSGAATLMITGTGLKYYLLNGALGVHDVLPWILSGVAWFSVSSYLGWVNHRGRNT